MANEDFRQKLKTHFSKDYMSLVAVIIIFIVFSFCITLLSEDEQCYEYFPADSNRSDCGNWPGMLIITGQVDLSLGYQVCLTGCVFAYMMKFQKWNPRSSYFIGSSNWMCERFREWISGSILEHSSIYRNTWSSVYFAVVQQRLLRMLHQSEIFQNPFLSLETGYIGIVPVPILFDVGSFHCICIYYGKRLVLDEMYMRSAEEERQHLFRY